MPAGRPSDYTPISYIYSLSDPRSEDVRYIGKTDYPLRRKQQHAIVQLGSTHRKKWINSLLAIGLKPKFTILQVVSANGWQEAERYWIEKYKLLGAQLVNYDDGGIGAISGGKQRRMHFIKRELISIYNMFKNRNSPISVRVAAKLRFLYQVVPNCPRTWEKIGLHG